MINYRTFCYRHVSLKYRNKLKRFLPVLHVTILIRLDECRKLYFPYTNMCMRSIIRVAFSDTCFSQRAFRVECFTPTILLLIFVLFTDVSKPSNKRQYMMLIFLTRDTMVTVFVLVNYLHNERSPVCGWITFVIS